MNIDLVYYFREVNHNYFLNGPEKVNGNIVNNSPAYQLSTASDVITKINQMIASLAPDITNVGIITSELYAGDIQINTYRGELNFSSVPDYTQVLTNINNSLVNIGVKLSTSQNGNNQTGIASILSNIFQYSNGASSIKSVATTTDSMNSANLIKQINRLISMFYYSDPNYYEQINSSQKLLRYIYSTLKQSVSPNASITDVISSLNTNIHNDLTNINTTENNKDTVLIIDGQQEFKLHKDDE